MEYRKLYQNQLKENHDLKTQINILETILRNYIPVVEKRRKTKMENQYLKNPEETNLYGEPSDDELQRIENELLDFLD